MTVYSESNSLTLLTGATDPEGDPITVARINGTLVSSWPHSVTLTSGSVSVTQGGVVSYDDGGDVLGHPSSGSSAPNGSFTFTLTDGHTESPVYTCDILLNGQAVTSGPSGYGWDPDWDSGLTSGDFYVSPAGSDSNAGTSPGAPKRTVQAAWDASSDGDVILLRGGTYREALNVGAANGDSAGRTISRYGAEKPKITGGEVLTGWTQCTSADQPLLGANYASIYKVTLAKSAYAASSPLGLNLHESDTWMSIAVDRADMNAADLFFPRRRATMHVADAMGLNGSNKITSISDSSVFGQYTSAQILNASVYVYHSPNTASSTTITNFSGSTITLANHFTVQGNKPNPKADDLRYSLINILPTLAPGRWGYVDGGGSTITVYCWPTNPSNLAGAMTYSARSHGIDLVGADNLTLQGIDLTQFGGDGTHQGVGIGTITSWTSHSTNNLTVTNCRVKGTANGQESYGALTLWQSHGLRVSRCSFEDLNGSNGYSIMRSNDIRIENCYFYRSTDTGARHFDVTDARFTYNFMDRCGRDAHANQFIFYDTGPGSDHILVYGVKTRHMGGYVSWQGCSDIHVGFCDFSAEDNAGFRRSINDQNGAIYGVVSPGVTCYLWNSFAHPAPSDLGTPGGNQNGVRVGIPGVNVPWAVYGCIGHGLTYNSSVITDHSHNVWTGQSAQQDAGDGWSNGASEVITTNNSANYTDAAAGDFTPMQGSALLSTPARNMSSIISGTLQSKFPGFDFTKDINGNTINWSTQKVGPFANGMSDWTA